MSTMRKIRSGKGASPFRQMVRLATMLLLTIAVLAGCASGKADTTFRDGNMDFGSLRTVAVLPFQNLTRESSAGERVRDVFMTSLLATGGVYVVPPGEVLRGMQRAAISVATSPSTEEVVKLGGFVKAEAVVTGVIKEYGEVRSRELGGKCNLRQRADVRDSDRQGRLER